MRPAVIAVRGRVKMCGGMGMIWVKRLRFQFKVMGRGINFRNCEGMSIKDF